jgi:hypothetical protein
VRIALDKTEGFPFERFAIAFYAALSGAAFVPLGGVKDGGADARDGTLYEDNARPETYYQASTEVDTEDKIRRTVTRLRDFGREPKVVYYLTSRTVKYSDRVERDLSGELDVTIVIRDAGYITAHVNDDPAARGAFDEHLRHYTEFLKQVGASRLITTSQHVKSPAVYVFLSQELERRDGDESLVNAVVDALALWALEGTDPDAEILRTANEVLAKIVGDLPSVKALVEPRLRRRLRAMSGKHYRGGRAVNWHQTQDAFCLPYQTRLRIEEENTADEALRLEVLAGFDERLRAQHIEGLGDVRILQAAEVALRSLQLAFERNGLEFASFLRAEDNAEYSTITDCLAAALAEYGLTGRNALVVGDGAYIILRGVLYDSQAIERDYLQRLSRTYALLFTLSTEPKLIEFFQAMTGGFRLYVGADQIVRALSEHYLDEPDRMTCTTLLMASRLGTKLVLAEPVLLEVVHHLRVCDFEYRNHIQAVEPYLNYEIARNAPHIVLRAYLYARINPRLAQRKPKSWPAFIRQFCTYSELHKPAAIDEIRQYLQSRFGLTFKSAADLENLVDLDEVDALTMQLAEAKRDERLARNDALVALAVYGHRIRHRETSRVSEFGYATWWLTGETAILKYTRDIVRKHGARYVMRPDFLLNFLTLAPSATATRQTFAAVFPSLLGIKLARRMQPDAFNRIMDDVAAAEELDDARRTVVISKAVDKLKSDFTRQYTILGPGSRPSAVDVLAEQAAINPGRA